MATAEQAALLPSSIVYDVAISFAEVDAAAALVAAELAIRLSRRGLRVYYFRSIEEAATTLGEQLNETLTSVYADRSRVVVAVGSEHYGQTYYTALEYTATRSRQRDADGRARLIPLSADGNLVPGLPGDTHYLSIGKAVDHLCQRCGRSSEYRIRRRTACILVGLSAAFLTALWTTRADADSIVAWAISSAALGAGPIWAGAFLAIPSAWMWTRRRAIRGSLTVVTEGSRLLVYRRVGAIAAWALLAIWSIAAMSFLIDIGLSRAIVSDLRGQRLEKAKKRWLRWNPSLFYHRTALQTAINSEIASTVRMSPSFDEALTRMLKWRSDPVWLDSNFEVVRKELPERWESVLTRTIYSPPTEPVVRWCENAWDIGLWAPEADEWAGLVGRLGARQLLINLVDEGADPFSWFGGRLRDFEVKALEAYANEVVAHHRVENWGTAHHGLAIMALTRDWSALGKAAAAELRGDDQPAKPSYAIVFISHAPLELVRPWIGANLGDWIKGHVLNAVGKAVESRGDPESMFALLDLAQSGHLTYDPFSRFGSLTLPDSPRTGTLAIERILKWVSTGSPPRPSVLDCLLNAACRNGGFDSLDSSQRTLLLESIVHLLDRAHAAVEDGDPNREYREVASSAYDAIARLSSRNGIDFLERELAETASHRSGGPQERNALIRALRASRPDDMSERALLLAKATREDAVQFGYDDSAVQAEYLLTFAADPQHPERHREFVASLLNLYGSAAAKPRLERPVFLTSVRQGFVSLFHRLCDRELALLFRHHHPENHNFPDGTWELFFLSICRDAKQTVPDEVESDILVKLDRKPQRQVPSQDSSLVRGIMESAGYLTPWDEIPDVLANCGGTQSLTFFQRQFQAGREDALRLLARLGDADTVCLAIEQIRTGTEPRRLEAVARAVQALPVSSRLIALKRCVANRTIPVSSFIGAVDDLPAAGCSEVIVACLKRGDTPVTLLFDHAIRVEFRDEQLVKLARSEVTQSNDLQKASSALRYLYMAAPDFCSEMLGDSQVVGRVADLLRDAGETEWTSFVERVDLPSDSRARKGVAKFAAARAGLIALKPNQIAEREWIQNGAFPANGMIVRNLLLAQLCRGGGLEEGRAAVFATSIAAGRPIVQIGNLTEAESTYRAYGLWIAAAPFAEDPPPVAELFSELQVLRALFSGNDVLARGAASVCIATCFHRFGAR